MGDCHVKKIALGGAAVIATMAMAPVAQAQVPATFVVPNDPVAGPAGFTFTVPDGSNGTVLNLTVSGLSFLQDAQYGVNPAGVVVVPGSVGTGGSSTDPQSGFTYGALLVTLNNNKTVQLFPASAANGLGSATPPTSLTYVGTLAQLFAIPARQQLASVTLTFRVDDTDYSNNAGGFTVVNNAASVPEPATWAMMLLGFGMVGFGLRSRRDQAVRVTYA